MMTPEAKPTARRATAKDVAQTLGLSRTTVGYVLNNTPGQSIPAATRQKVMREAARLGYRPHSAARALASGRTRVVLLMLPDWPIDYTMRRNIEEATHTLEKAGYALITSTIRQSTNMRLLWEVLEPDAVLGYVPFSEEHVTEMRRSNVARIIPNPDTIAQLQRYPEEGPAIQIRHLIEQGHRRLAFAATADPRVRDLCQRRYERARDFAQESGIQLSTESIDYRDNSANEAVEKWLAEGVTGVACYNDDVAATLIGRAIESGIDVPDKISVVGLDDAPIASIMHPQITSVRLDAAGLGVTLAQLAIAEIEDRPYAATASFPQASLVIRSSTAAPNMP
ncbi:LacI family DNA-binding transcriptional regulator [Paenarthrobacter sp. NPDC057981]|uniref:LacI family DNA-binding transcriptional regulator n=1 Tax=Paenarthrobacter sp. NPDC057981 TaxID=3346297 RepID=UPI0036D8B1E9